MTQVESGEAPPVSAYDFTVKDIKGKDYNLSEKLKGKVTLIVNVASFCGFTKQYPGLEKLHNDFEDRGFSVIGFPCNQFGSQEPGNSEEIAEFCSKDHLVTFPIMEKIAVNGSKAAPLYTYLKKAKPGVLNTKAIKWNFTKFLVDSDGVVLKRFGSTTSPQSIRKEIEKLLPAPEVSEEPEEEKPAADKAGAEDEKPASDEPAAKADEPTTVDPKVEEPATVDTKAEEPKAEEPKTEEPKKTE